MVKFSWEEGDGKSLRSLRCSGHAGFEDGQGLDLVCAAVSALTGALGLGFSRLLEVPHQIEVEHGLFQVGLLPDAESHPDWKAAQVLLQTTQMALLEMAEVYPGFITVDLGKEEIYE